jgi:hypothetical protein
VIGLIPARHGWEVPGLLSWSGAVNYDLDGAHHVAVLRHWQELGYCPDLDVQGTGMVAVLANEVVPHRRWSFWWD